MNMHSQITQPPLNRSHIADIFNPLSLNNSSVPLNFSHNKTPIENVKNAETYLKLRFDIETSYLKVQGTDPFDPKKSPVRIISESEVEVDMGFFDEVPQFNGPTQLDILPEFINNGKSTMTFLQKRRDVNSGYVQISGLASEQGYIIHRFARRHSNNDIQVFAILPKDVENARLCCKQNELRFIFRENFLEEPNLTSKEVLDAVNKYYNLVNNMRTPVFNLDNVPVPTIKEAMVVVRAIIAQNYAPCPKDERIAIKNRYKCDKNHSLDSITIKNPGVSAAHPTSLYETAEYIHRNHKNNDCIAFKEGYKRVFSLPIKFPLVNCDSKRQIVCSQGCNLTYSYYNYTNRINPGNCHIFTQLKVCLHFTTITYFQHNASAFLEFAEQVRSRSLTSCKEVIGFFKYIRADLLNSDVNTLRGIDMTPLFLAHDLFVRAFIDQKFVPCFNLLEYKENQMTYYKTDSERGIHERSRIYSTTYYCRECKHCIHGNQIGSCMDKIGLVHGVRYFKQRNSMTRCCYLPIQIKDENTTTVLCFEGNKAGYNITTKEYMSFYLCQTYEVEALFNFQKYIETIAVSLNTSYKVAHRMYALYLKVCMLEFPLLGKHKKANICSRTAFLKHFHLASDIFILAHQLASEYQVCCLETRMKEQAFKSFKDHEILNKRALLVQITKDEFFDFMATLDVGTLFLITGCLIYPDPELIRDVKRVCNKMFAIIMRSFEKDSNISYSINGRITEHKIDNWDPKEDSFGEDLVNKVKSSLSQKAPEIFIRTTLRDANAYMLCNPLWIAHFKSRYVKPTDEKEINAVNFIKNVHSLEFLILKQLETYPRFGAQQCAYDFIQNHKFGHICCHLSDKIDFILNHSYQGLKRNKEFEFKKLYTKIIDCLSGFSYTENSAKAIKLLMEFEYFHDLNLQTFTFGRLVPTKE